MLKLSVLKVTQRSTASKTVERFIPRSFLAGEQVDVDGGVIRDCAQNILQKPGADHSDVTDVTSAEPSLHKIAQE